MLTSCLSTPQIRRSRHYFRPRSVFDFLERKLSRFVPSDEAQANGNSGNPGNEQTESWDLGSFKVNTVPLPDVDELLHEDNAGTHQKEGSSYPPL